MEPDPDKPEKKKLFYHEKDHETFRVFEESRSKLQGIFDRKEFCLIQIRSLTPRQATGNMLAVAVQISCFRDCFYFFCYKIHKFYMR
ncbi:MAG: hypothetical protein DRH90_22975 [Deltaproteobacteria bacterium]|nr:MAG: hypothetical protein DRH90_22975 [Deltaproteobacteria bacterium]